MLMLMRHDKMDASSSGGGGGASGGRHVRTHLFFSDFDHHRNHRSSTSGCSDFGGGAGSSRGGRLTGRLTGANRHNNNNNRNNRNHNNNNNNNNDDEGSKFCQESELMSSPISDPSRPRPLTPSAGRSRGFGRENSRTDAALVKPTLTGVRPPFIQISGPRPDSGQSTRSGSTKSRTSGSSTPVAGRQGGVTSGGATPRNGRKVLTSGRIEQVQEDCFVIPAHRMGTFLPIALPFESEKSLGALSMLHVDDPQLCIILHFAEPSSSLAVQLTGLKSSLTRVSGAGQAREGMLLMNMERNASYPFIMYMVINTAQTPPCAFLQSYNSIIVDELQPDRHNAGTNYISGYEEVATIFKAPIDIGQKTSSNPKTGYLITIFKVFPGDDREKLERSWLLWTGARTIYKHLPPCLGLRRITFHKKLWPDGGITYILLCECTDLLENITVACGFVEQLRARCCGYTALYKSVSNF